MHITLDILGEDEEETVTTPEQLELPFYEAPALQLVETEKVKPLPLPLFLPDLL